MNIKQIKLSDLKIGPIRHQELPDDFIQRVKNLKQALIEVETSPLEKTLEDFQKDLNPEKELLVWEKIASTYQWTVIGYPGLSLAEKKDVFGVLLGLSMAMKDFSNIKHLSKDKIDAIVNYYS